MKIISSVTLEEHIQQKIIAELPFLESDSHTGRLPKEESDEVATLIARVVNDLFVQERLAAARIMEVYGYGMANGEGFENHRAASESFAVALEGITEVGPAIVLQEMALFGPALASPGKKYKWTDDGLEPVDIATKLGAGAWVRLDVKDGRPECWYRIEHRDGQANNVLCATVTAMEADWSWSVDMRPDHRKSGTEKTQREAMLRADVELLRGGYEIMDDNAPNQPSQPTSIEEEPRAAV